MRQFETIQSLERQLVAAKHKAISELLEERKKKQAEIADLDTQLAKLGHALKGRGKRAGQRVCRACGQPGHNSRSCAKT